VLIAATTGKELWYMTRGSGVVALLLLTASTVIGVLSGLRVRGKNWPRFAVASIHRNLTLLTIVFIALHVVTTIADGYAPIGLKDGIIPFTSPYRPLWLGLGTVAFDLLLALVVTSLARERVGARLWRALHWAAYACWPIALVHTFGTGSDARTGWLALVGFGSLAVVALAALARVGLSGGPQPVRLGAAAASLAVPLLILLWFQSGPGRNGWAARAGTPASLIASKRTSTLRPRAFTSAVMPPHAFNTRVAGTITQRSTGEESVRVVLNLKLDGGPGGALRVDLSGVPVDGGVAMRASGVSFVPAVTGAVYLGSVTALNGSALAAAVKDSSGDALDLGLNLSIDAGRGTVTGTLDAATPGASSG